jgi:hypothetical protein
MPGNLASDLAPEPTAYITKVWAPLPVTLLHRLHLPMREPEPEPEAEPEVEL